MAKRLTSFGLDKIRREATAEARRKGDRHEAPIDGCGGYFVAQASGKEPALAYRYRRPGTKEPAKVTYDGPPLTPAGIGKWLADQRHKIEQGIDPGAAKRQAKEAERDRAADTVANVVAQFVELHCKRRLRSWQQAERVLRVEVVPRWRGKTVYDIRKRDIHAMLDAIAADRPVLANRVFAYVRKFFAWCVERGILVTSPCAGVRMPAKETPRERVLSDTEIVQFWHAVEGEAAGPYFKTLLLAGQRRTETATMCRVEIDEQTRTWTIPSVKTKNAKTHAVPLSRQAWKIVQDMPRVAGNDRVFATLPTHRGFNACKKRLDARMQLATSWTAHDLRRTVATGLQRLGVRLEVTEAVLNHTSGSRAGIVAVYQRYDWADEKRAALQRWADHVEELVGGVKEPKIIQFGR
jgi:integrase